MTRTFCLCHVVVTSWRKNIWNSPLFNEFFLFHGSFIEVRLINLWNFAYWFNNACWFISWFIANCILAVRLFHSRLNNLDVVNAFFFAWFHRVLFIRKIQSFLIPFWLYLLSFCFQQRRKKSLLIVLLNLLKLYWWFLVFDLSNRSFSQINRRFIPHITSNFVSLITLLHLQTNNFK